MLVSESFTCSCDAFSHVVRFVFDDEDGDAWIETNVNPYLPWHRRLVEAVRYALGTDPAQQHYDTVVLRNEDLNGLRALLDKAIAASRSRSAHGSPRENSLRSDEGDHVI